MLVCNIIIDYTLSAADIIDMNDIDQYISRLKFRYHILRRFQFLRRETDRLLIVEYGRIKNLRFDKILKYMTSVG